MESPLRTIATIALFALTLTACADKPFMGEWTIDRADPAPWVDADFVPDDATTALYVGQTVKFAPDQIEAPGLLACTNPTYNFVDVPAPGIFQGGLGNDAGEAVTRAKKLGFGAYAATVKTACEHDIAFHMRDANHAAFALDNMIYWLTRKR